MHALASALSALALCASVSHAAPVAAPHMRFFRRMAAEDSMEQYVREMMVFNKPCAGEGVMSCDAAGRALSCATSHYLNGGSCVTSCPEGTHTSLSRTCVTCDDGLFFDATHSTCVASCPLEMWEVPAYGGHNTSSVQATFGNPITGECEVCHDDLAYECDSEGEAVTCWDSYVYDGACLSWEQCAGNGGHPVTDFSRSPSGAFFLGTCEWRAPEPVPGSGWHHAPH